MDKSIDQMRLKTTCREVERVAKGTLGKQATLVSPLIMGGFNIIYRISLEGGLPMSWSGSPAPAWFSSLDEKVLQETATANYLVENTKIPVPRHIFCGRDPTVGSFIILQHVASCGSLSARPKIPNEDLSVTHVLNPDVPESVLEGLWGKVAHQLLQISHLRFPRIGALMKTLGDDYSISGRPVTHNMTDMIRIANIPRAVLPQEGQTYGTADDWYVTLAEMHLAQLVFQRNDAVSSEGDCRNKYVARQNFGRLAKQGRLSTFG